MSAGVPLVLTFANVLAATGYECQNRNTGHEILSKNGCEHHAPMRASKWLRSDLRVTWSKGRKAAIFEATRHNARKHTRATLNAECCAFRSAPGNAPRPSS